MANPNKRSAFSKAFTFVNLRKIPGPRGWDYVVRYNLLFKKDVLGTFTQISKEYGDIASFPWPMNSVVIYSPEFVKKVLIEDGKKYIKGEQLEELRAVVGDGLSTNNDYKSWVKSRSIISKEFGPRAVEEFTKDFERICDEHLTQWENEFELNVCEDMRFLTFKIACQTLLKANLGREDSKAVNEAVHFTSGIMSQRIFQFFPVPYSWPSSKNKKFNTYYDELEAIVMKLIREEQEAGKKSNPKSVLEKLVHAVDENGSGLSKEELRDEVLTMLLAGHETSAHSLTWIIGLLAKHQDVQQNLFDLLHSQSHEASTLLRQIILESMRLYPAFPILSRKASEVVTLGSYTIPKNTNVVIPIYVMQRSEALWSDPLAFRPERFSVKELESSFSFLPFSKGTRKCVAELFAMSEILTAIRKIILRYQITLTETDLPKPQATITLKPEKDFMVRLTKRGPK